MPKKKVSKASASTQSIKKTYEDKLIRDNFFERKQRRIQLFHKAILEKGTHILDSHIEATVVKEIHGNDLLITCKIKKIKGENEILQDDNICSEVLNRPRNAEIHGTD